MLGLSTHKTTPLGHSTSAAVVSHLVMDNGSRSWPACIPVCTRYPGHAPTKEESLLKFKFHIHRLRSNATVVRVPSNPDVALVTPQS